jgi:predicted nucleotidyltransferase
METVSPVKKVLGDFVDVARRTFGEDLRSIVLFGSAAEDRLRAASDVNVLLVLRRFEPSRAESFADEVRLALAAIRLVPMFVLESELPAAAEAFAVKFADVKRRHRVLYGESPFGTVRVPREAHLRRLRQVLLNQVLRLRQRYTMAAGREEQLVAAIADSAGPLRSCAASLLELEDRHVPPPREALVQVAASLGDAGAAEVVARLSEARERGVLPKGEATTTLIGLIGIAERLRARAGALS